MPRSSQKKFALNRQAIKIKASILFRERGFDGVGIPEITRAAGLTPGSFYGHFASKEELAVEASDSAFDSGFADWEEHRISRQPLSEARARFIAEYLTVKNRDNPGEAGPIATLVGDVARMPPDAPIRKVFVNRIREALEKLWAVVPGEADERSEKQALNEFSAIVGAMLLSRATVGDELSEKFLDAVSASITRRQ